MRVFCLCAAWCRTCDDYRAVFDAAAAAHAGRARFDWIDLEDDEDLVGDLDVRDFPTLLIGRGTAPVFIGPLTPQPAVLARLLCSALDGSLVAVADPEAAAFLARVEAAGR